MESKYAEKAISVFFDYKSNLMATMKKKAKIEDDDVWLGVVGGCTDITHSHDAHSQLLVMRHISSNILGCRRYAETWNEAMNVLQACIKELPSSTQIRFYIEHRDDQWMQLPERVSLESFRNLKQVSMYCYPTLEHIDAGNLPHLTYFALNRTYYKDTNYLGRYLRISGLATCQRLERLYLFSVEGRPYVLRLNAPVRNLRALTHVWVGSSCMNRRLPLELGSSPALRHFEINGTSMLRTIKAKRKFVVCLCIALHNTNTFNSLAFVNAVVSGPIHDPALIHDVGNKLSVNH